MDPAEPEHVMARGQRRARVAAPQQVHQGRAVESRHGPADDRRNAVAPEMAHEEVGGGGQIGDRTRAIRGHAAPSPIVDRLPAHAEQAGRLGLTQAPRRDVVGPHAPKSIRNRTSTATVRQPRRERSDSPSPTGGVTLARVAVAAARASSGWRPAST